MRVVSGVALHTFPSNDDDFRRATQRLVTESWGRIHSTERLIADVQAALRETYPEALVRVKDAVAELGDPEIRTVYAFRDGRAA